MTAKEIYSIQPDERGWRVLPNGSHLHLGEHVELGEDVVLENCVRLGDYVYVGDGVRIGNQSKIGQGSILQEGSSVGSLVVLGQDVSLRVGAGLEDFVKVGEYSDIYRGVKVGKSAILGQGVEVGDFATIVGRSVLGNGVVVAERARVDARLVDGVRVGPGVQLNGTPPQVVCGPYPVYPYSQTEVGIGCQVDTINFWQSGDAELLLENYPECRGYVDVYKAAVSLVASIMPKYFGKEPKS